MITQTVSAISRCLGTVDCCSFVGWVAPTGAIDLSTRSHCAYGAYGVNAIGASDFSTRSHCAYGTYGVDGGSMVEVGRPIERGCSVRIEGLFRPFAFRGACRSRARFRRPALFAPIGAIHFSMRNHCAYGTLRR
jgi:hypothetical protein